jgi:hypothetical protein
LAELLAQSTWEQLPHAAQIQAVLDGRQTINWKFGYGDKWSAVHGGGCCGTMPSNPAIKKHDLHTIIATLRINGGGDPSTYEWYWTNILSKETSPWHGVLPDKGATIYKSGAKWAFELPITGASSFSNVINMIIATRQTMVEPSNVKYIRTVYDRVKKVDKTVTFSEAMAMAIMEYDFDTYGLMPNKFNTGNGWLGTARDFSPAHFAQRKMTEGSGRTFALGSYYPSCATWRHTPAYNSYKAFLESTVAKKEGLGAPVFNRNSYGGPLHYVVMSSYKVPPEKMLEFLRKGV